MKIISIVGARPNFMKVAPIYKQIRITNEKLRDSGKTEVEHLICHTGQHYDEKMSKIFFEDLGLPKPDYYLGVGSGSHAEQTAKIMIEFEKVVIKEKPDLVIVVGDVNSTIACALTAKKLNVKVAHVEAGLRSFDWTMPEEINRILTDRISDYLFVSEPSGLKNLAEEGIPDNKVFYTGNVMIDSLIEYLPKASQSNILTELGLNQDPFVLITMHRPSNVDNPDFLKRFFEVLNCLAKHRKIIFPIHPRTRSNMVNSTYNPAIPSSNRPGTQSNQSTNHPIIQSLNLSSNIILTDPLGYIDFLALTKHADLIITDSGGIQEESTYLGVQCITVRESTERPVTVDVGTNQLIGTDLEKVKEASLKVLNGNKKQGSIPELWDGKAALRIVEHLIN